MTPCPNCASRAIWVNPAGSLLRCLACLFSWRTK